jgi:hypothetical protein
VKLGMQVDLTGQDASGTATMGSASTVVFSSAIEGPVDATDAAAGTLSTLGQTVNIDANTVWDATLTGGLAGLAQGAVVKVFALYDAATNRYIATRIEPDTGATQYKLRGVVSNLDTTAKTYAIGTTVIDFSSVTSVPAGLANGVVATAELQTTQGASGWVATGMQLRHHGAAGAHATVHVRGLVANYTSATSFTLDGWPIDASAAVFPAGQSVIVAGAEVQVDGIVTNGTLVASRVDIQQPGSHGGLDFQVHGPIDSISTSAQTFQLRGTTVSYAGTVAITGGTAASLAVGTSVLVQGTIAKDGSSVQAAKITIGQ